ncbi:transcription elongation factor GreA [Minwuia thermotolerans]|uniref:Transcription elongation factor GreA n=1 Tax=Minwuia thermotolerans TaxID=2056226 RepID=A0A2M9FWF9_9PROT|nr:transcription elongation factor GreA [Minwuia thermotolerans]PJK27805.1 transcription elongation factor GreA [Minwuia thermotolerans]
MERVPMTLRGHKRLEAELKNLKSVERPAVIQAIAEARAHGDLSENAEYHAAKEKQGFIESRVMELESALGRAEVIDSSKMSGDIVRFGATVMLADVDNDEESTYQIVGVDEADIDSGLVSITSPIARALIGKSEGDVVDVQTPRGEKSYEILEVKWI